MGIKWYVFWIPLVVVLGSSGCKEKTQCEKDAIAACEQTRETIAFFNQGMKDEKYMIEDCLKLIPLRCPSR